MLDKRLNLICPVRTLAVYAFLLVFMVGCQSWFGPSPGTVTDTITHESGVLTASFWSTEKILMGVATLLVLCSIAAVVVPIFMSRPPCVRCALSCVAGWVGCLVWLFIIQHAALLVTIAVIGGVGVGAYILWLHKWSIARTLADSTPLTPDSTPTGT